MNKNNNGKKSQKLKKEPFVKIHSSKRKKVTDNKQKYDKITIKKKKRKPNFRITEMTQTAGNAIAFITVSRAQNRTTFMAFIYS